MSFFLLGEGERGGSWSIKKHSWRVRSGPATTSMDFLAGKTARLKITNGMRIIRQLWKQRKKLYAD